MSTMIKVDKPRRRDRGFIDPNLLPAMKRVNPPFFYAHYENGWEFDTEHGFIPTLCRYAAVPGVNGVGDRGEGINRVKQGVISKGGIVIEPTDPRLLCEGESPDGDDQRFYDYVRYYPCKDGKRHYIEPGQVPTITRRGVVLWNEDEAAEEFLAFRQHLLSTNIIQPIHHLEYVRLRQEAIKSVDRLTSRSANAPALLPRLQAAQARLKAMEAEWDRLTAQDLAEVEPAKQPRRRAIKARKESST